MSDDLQNAPTEADEPTAGQAMYSLVESLMAPVAEDTQDGDDSTSVEDVEANPEDNSDEPLEAATSDEDPEPEGEDKADKAEEEERGYLRHADYTRKTQALADQRRALDAQAKELEQLIQDLRSMRGTKQAPAKGADEVSEDEFPADWTPQQVVREIARREAEKVASRPNPADQMFADVSAAYAEYVARDGVDVLFQNPEVGNAVGAALSGNPALLALAEKDPAAAVEIAAATVNPAQVVAAKQSQSKQSTRKAATAASSVRSKTGRAPTTKPLTAMDVARRAMGLAD